MKKKLLLTGWFMLIFLIVNAQTGYKIRGFIYESKDKKPLELCTVVLTNEANKITAYSFSDSRGAFIIEGITPGSYLLFISLMGYQALEIPVTVTDKAIDLEPLFIEETPEELDEVIVSSNYKTPMLETFPDRVVVNVSKDLISSGASISQILDNLPFVSADYDGNINIRGDQNVRYYLNDKPTRQNLSSIAPDKILKVEVITSPSAKWDSDGSAIINIITRKEMYEGFQGTATINYGISKTPKYGAGISLDFASGRNSIYTNLTLRKDYAFFSGRTQDFLNGWTQETRNTSLTPSGNWSLGWDYFVNSKNEMSLSYERSVNKPSGLSEFDLTNAEKTFQQTDYNYNNHTVNYRYRKFFKTSDQFLEAEAFYMWSPKESEREDVYRTSPAYLEFSYRYEGDFSRYQFNLDYENKIEGNLLSLGVQGSFHDVNQNLLNQNFNPDFFSDYQLRYGFSRNILAAYGDYKVVLKDWNIYLGLRGENVSRKLDLNNNAYQLDYTSFFPKLTVSLQASEKIGWHLDYSRRIVRPDHWLLTDIPKYFSPTSYAIRNPRLEPSYITQVQLARERKTKTANSRLNLYFRNIRNRITYIQKLDPNQVGVYIFTLDNTDSHNSLGLELIQSWTVNKYYTVNATADVNNSVLQAVIDDKTIRRDYIAYNLRINNRIKIDENSFQLNFRYNGNAVFPQGKRAPYGRFDLGYSHKLFNDNGSISARLTDIFNDYKPEYSIKTEVSDRKGIFDPETRMFYIRLTYNFLSKERKKFNPINRMNIQQRDLNGVQF